MQAEAHGYPEALPKTRDAELDAWAEAEVDRMWDNIVIGNDLPALDAFAPSNLEPVPNQLESTVSGSPLSDTHHTHAHEGHDHAEHTQAEDLTRKQRRIAYLGATAIGLGLAAIEAGVQLLEHKNGQPIGKIVSSTMFNDMRHNGIIDVSVYLSLAWASTTSKVGRFFSRFAGGAIVAGNGLSLYSTAEMALHDRDELLHGHQSVASRLGTGVIMAAGNILQMRWVKTKTRMSNHPDHRRSRRHANYDGYGSIAKVALNDVPLIGEAVATYLNIRDTETGVEGALGDKLACHHNQADETSAHTSWKSRICSVRNRLKTIRNREDDDSPERRQTRRRRLITAGVGALALLAAAYTGNDSGKAPEVSKIASPDTAEVAAPDTWGGPDALDTSLSSAIPEQIEVRQPTYRLPAYGSQTDEGTIWDAVQIQAASFGDQDLSNRQIDALSDFTEDLNGRVPETLQEGEVIQMPTRDQSNFIVYVNAA